MDGIISPRDAAIPDARRDEDDAAPGGEPNQKWHGQIKIRADCARRRKFAAQIRIKCAGPRALKTFLEDQLQRLVIAREGGGASVGAGHALGGVGFGAVGAQRASAIGADGDGFGMVRETFHGVSKSCPTRLSLASCQH
jgi:hypothetical protein